MGCFELHNGRRLSFYTTLLASTDDLPIPIDVINTGPKVGSYGAQKPFQIFVRTLMG